MASLSAELVTEAAQGSSEVHMYALLAMSVCRVGFVHRMAMPDDYAREKYLGMTVRALRKYLASNRPIAPRAVFDVSLTILNEDSVSESHRAKVPSQMMSCFVGVCGGLPNIQPFFAQVAAGADVLTTMMSFAFPAFDLHNDPGKSSRWSIMAIPVRTAHSLN